MQLPTKKIELDRLHWACYLTEPIPVHTKTDPLEWEFLAHLQLNESKVRLSCSSDFDFKKVGKCSTHDEADEYLVGTN